MKKFFNLLKKELRELITLRMIIPFLVAMFVLIFIGRMAKGEMIKSFAPSRVGLVDFDKTPPSENLIKLLEDAKYIVVPLQSVERDSIIKEATVQGIKILIVIPEGFGHALETRQGTTIEFYSIIKSISLAESMKKASVRNILWALNQQLSDKYIKELSGEVDPATIKNPIKSQEFIVFKDNIGRGSPEMLFNLIMSQNFMVPVILMLLIILTGTMIAASIGQEKENKTLETLMTVPVSRLSIVTAKMLAAAILALIFAGFYMLAMGSYMASMIPTGITLQGISQMSQELSRDLGLALDFKSNLLLGINIFLAIVAALSMSTLLALFAKDVKDAQATIAPLMVMVLLPYFFSIFFDPDTVGLPLKIIIYIIPFSHTFFALKFLIMGKVMTVIYGIIYLAVFSMTFLFLAAKVFSSDKLLTMKLTLFTRRKTMLK